MTKQEKNFSKFPEKTKTFADGATVKFKKLYDDQPSGLIHYPQRGGYQSRFPSVYSSDKLDGEGFIRLYDFVTDEYLETRNLIDIKQWTLYNYIGTLSNRGYYVSINGRKTEKGEISDADVKGLAQIFRVDPKNLTADIDHLQDCLLVHRVRRLDLQGMPNELVYHTGFTAKQLDAGKQKVIVDRTSRLHAKTKRSKAITKSNGKNGGFGYLNRKETDDRFHFDYNQIKKAFGESSRHFTDFALEFFQTHKRLLETNKSQFEKGYRVELNRNMTDWGIGGNSAREDCYKAANKFRTIYCPTFEELCS